MTNSEFFETCVDSRVINIHFFVLISDIRIRFQRQLFNVTNYSLFYLRYIRYQNRPWIISKIRNNENFHRQFSIKEVVKKFTLSFAKITKLFSKLEEFIITLLYVCGLQKNTPAFLILYHLKHSNFF